MSSVPTWVYFLGPTIFLSLLAIGKFIVRASWPVAGWTVLRKRYLVARPGLSTGDIFVARQVPATGEVINQWAKFELQATFDGLYVREGGLHIIEPLEFLIPWPKVTYTEGWWPHRHLLRLDGEVWLSIRGRDLPKVTQYVGDQPRD